MNELESVNVPNPSYYRLDSVVACCTKDSILHLFKSKERFLEFMKDNASSLGLVVAWVDGVKIEETCHSNPQDEKHNDTYFTPDYVGVSNFR